MILLDTHALLWLESGSRRLVFHQEPGMMELALVVEKPKTMDDYR